MLVTPGLFHRCVVSITRTVPDSARITMELVVAPPPMYRTPFSRLPSVTPVAAKKTWSPLQRSSTKRMASRSYPCATALARSSSSRGHSLPWMVPPMHFIAAAEMTPSGVPPMPSRMSTDESGRQTSMEAATSPSLMRRMRAPASRTSLMSCSWRGRSRMTAVTSLMDFRFASATASRLRLVLYLRLTECGRTSGPTTSFSMYMQGPGS
mmetsp:Transcript_13816/g.35488  ORF Transcript_13816/g.35488 Transcript_13816/m.35488 type:complete len:209 (+) Transcript_13816:401-1027(+)